MNVLEKILEEIEHEAMTNKEIGRKQCEGMTRAMNIIRSYMNVVTDTNVGSNVGWIPVEERLPEEGENVLCTDGKYIYLIEYDADIDAGFEDIDGIIACQPLPEPYKGEEAAG